MAGSARRGALLAAAVALALGTVAFTLRSGTEREAAFESPLWESSARPDREHDASATSVAPQHHGRVELGPADAAPAQRAAIQVDVVDARGAPASGVSLVCGIVSPSAATRFDARLRTRTDANGSAEIELADLPPAPLRLRAEILADSTCEVAFDPLMTEDRIVLQLPPTGSVHLRAIDVQGRATTTPVRFGLWARAEGATRDVEPLPRWIDAVDGLALLEHVGLGLELRLTAVPAGGDARAERITASGPASQGEERAIDVPLAERWPTALVRALDENGNALGNELLDVEVRWSPSSSRPTWGSGRSAMQVRTDGEGRARFPLRGTVARGAARRLVLRSTGRAVSDVVRSAERDLSWDVPPGGEVDLGDVQLRPHERATDTVAWASGTVTDAHGMPVGDATVLVSVTDAEGASLRDLTAQARVEPDGRFVVTGPPVAQRLTLRAIAPGFLRSMDEIVVPGARDLSIRMRAAARWTGHLRLDDDVSPEDLVVEVITPERRLRTIPTSERVVVEGLEPGLVDVDVRTRVGDWLVERVEQLATSGAGAPGEARTDEIDLRGRLVQLRLHLAEPDGTALERVLARVQPDGWPEGDVWVQLGRLDLLVPGEAGAITLRPQGYPSLSIEPRAGTQELTCGPRLFARQ